MQFAIFDLGLVDFKKAWDFQKQTFLAVNNHELPAALIICRHYPVITLGRQAFKNNILTSPEELEKNGIKVYEIERGGDVTYHGPGQLTVYPIFNLKDLKKDIHFFLRYLEDKVIDLLADFGVRALRYPGYTGVWIGSQKLASIGIAIKHWITFHGVSINIKKNDLDNFKFIRPCGMDIAVTSLETILNRNIEIDELKISILSKFREAWQPTLQEARL